MAHGPVVLDHYRNPRNVGSYPAGTPGTGTGIAGSAEAGDVVRIQIHSDGERVLTARFKTFGCTVAIAASSYATEHVTGLELTEARALEPDEIATALELPADKWHYGSLVVDAVRRAIDDYRAAR